MPNTINTRLVLQYPMAYIRSVKLVDTIITSRDNKFHCSINVGSKLRVETDSTKNNILILV